MTDYELDDRGIRVQFAAVTRDYLLSIAFRPSLEHMHSPVQQIPGIFPLMDKES
jgi:hypothetical protein